MYIERIQRMNLNVSPITGFPTLHDTITNKIGRDNPIILIVLSIIIIVYYFVFSYMGGDAGSSSAFGSPSTSTTSYGFSFVELLLWGLFIFLVLINGLQYFFSLDIQTAIKNIFSEPEIDITITRDEEKEQVVPEIMIEKQVFNVPENTYTYDDAKALCKAYGGRLAKYEEVEKAYQKGAQWCNYGWSEGQMILFPTQKETYDKLQKIPGHENDCGRPGINGGYIANTNAKFGVNCYGYKPEITPEEREMMEHVTPYPLTQKEKEMKQKVDTYKDTLHTILVSPFNNTRWSQI